MSRKISRGQRAHLLALYTPPGTVTIVARNKTHWPYVRARQGLKKLERAIGAVMP